MDTDARLQVAVETLRKAARKRQSRLWHAAIKRLRELGWLGKPEIQDALLMAPVSWLQAEGFTITVPTRDETGRLVTREVPAEVWEVVDAVTQALDVFGDGAQLVQLRRVEG